MTWMIEKHGNQYIIRATGSSCGGLCNAELSWDGATNHPMASVEFNDRVYWTFMECTLDGMSGFHIVNQHSRYTGWQLSWDGRGNSHPYVSVEAINSDPVCWIVTPVDIPVDTFADIYNQIKNHPVRIRSQHPGKWKDAQLTWDTLKPGVHARATIQHDDPYVN